MFVRKIGMEVSRHCGSMLLPRSRVADDDAVGFHSSERYRREASGIGFAEMPGKSRPRLGVINGFGELKRRC